MEKPDRDFGQCLQYAVRSDVGMRRANNQDSYALIVAEDRQQWGERGHLFLVADGMGAHAAGELASKLATDNIPHLYRHYRDLVPSEALLRALEETNREIHRRGQANPDFYSMGTTASALALLPDGAVVGHVGDSRVYRLRGNRLDQLTFDHSLQWELRALGRLSGNAELAESVPKNVITRSLGPQPSVDVDLEGPFPVEVGDTYLLCSDGLSGQVPDRELGPLLAHLSPEQAATVLVDLANLRGGPDNITLIIARVTGDGIATDRSGGAAAAPTVRKQGSTGGLAAGVVSGVCLFLAGVLWLAHQPAPALVSAVAAVVSVVVGLVLRFRRRLKTEDSGSRPSMLGKGPHAHTICKSDDELVRTLSSILQELREAAEEEGWEIQWQQFERFQRNAQESAASKDLPEAVRHYARAISFMMEELRNQQSQQAGDSTIDY